MFQIDAMSREPVYEQIIHQVEQFILTDVLQPEAQIPSVRSVSMTNSINPRTILKAYTELDARGLIQSVSSKNKKAKELGIPILSEEDFLKMAQQ